MQSLVEYWVVLLQKKSFKRNPCMYFHHFLWHLPWNKTSVLTFVIFRNFEFGIPSQVWLKLKPKGSKEDGCEERSMYFHKSYFVIISTQQSTWPFIWPNLKDALVCKFGTLMNQWRMLWFPYEEWEWCVLTILLPPLPFKTVLYLNNLSFPSPWMLCTKIVWNCLKEENHN